MRRNDFDTWRRRYATLGRGRLANAIRHLIFHADEQLFDTLDFEDESQFLAPLLFAHFTDTERTVQLQQILYGAIPPGGRPETIKLLTNSVGRAGLGGFGLLETALPDADVTFGRDTDGRFACMTGTRAAPFRIRPPVQVPGTRIEVVTDISPLLLRFFDPANDPEALRVPPHRVTHVLLALGLIRQHCPAEWAEIIAHVRLIVLFRAASPNSFATKSAHGAIFCNLGDDEDEIALLEDVAHQAGHVVCNAFCQEPMRIFTIDPETPLNQFHDDPRDTRTINVAFQALFTYVLITRVLTKIHDAGRLPEQQAHEVLGRLGFTMLKFRMDLKRLAVPDAYAPAGWRCITGCQAECDQVHARYEPLVGLFQYDNQPYTFDYERFVERNGGPWQAASGMAL